LIIKFEYKYKLFLYLYGRIEKKQRGIRNKKNEFNISNQGSRDEIKLVKQNIYEECKLKTGHDFIDETEDGMYGETFYICKHCNYEK